MNPLPTKRIRVRCGRATRLRPELVHDDVRRFMGKHPQASIRSIVSMVEAYRFASIVFEEGLAEIVLTVTADGGPKFVEFVACVSCGQDHSTLQACKGAREWPRLAHDQDQAVAQA